MLVVRHVGDERVEVHAQPGKDAGGAPLFRHQGKAVADGLDAAGVAHLLATHANHACTGLADAEERLHNVGALGTHQPGNAQNLAPTQVEGHILDGRLVTGRQPPNLQHDLGRLVGLLREALAQFTTDHHLDDIIEGQTRDRSRVDPLAVAQDGDLIADAEDLVHLVRDVDDPAAAILQLLNDAEEMVDLLLGQRGGGLVHDDDLRVVRERLGDLDHLHLRNRQIGHLLARIHVDAQLVEDRLRVAVHLGMIDEEPLLGIAPQPEVVHHRHLRHQVQLLVHHGNAVLQRFLRGAERDRTATEQDLACIGTVDAEQALEQRGLARAVLAHQGMHGMGSDLQLRIVQRLDAGKALIDAAHLQQELACRCSIAHRG